MSRRSITRRSVAFVALVWAIAVLGPAPAPAQTVTGTLFGRVADDGGLVLPGVTVTVESPQLIGGVQSRPTNDSGEFRFPAMPPGTYTLSFELAGFQTLKRERVVLEAGASLAVDVVLRLAGVEETLTVVGETPLVDVRSVQNRETATRDLIENVPTGRTFVDVFNLMPGVVSGNYNVATTGTNSVHGGTVRNNVFSLDGVNVNDPLVAYPSTDVNLETIEEIQVTTAGMSAEFGSASGAVFNVITRSGGNTLSGQLNGYFRDESMQSSNVTDELRAQGVRAGTQLLRASDWGGGLGGPIVKNRLWYFGNYQRVDESRRIINFPPVVEADQDTTFIKLTGQLASRHRIDGFHQYRLRYDEPFIPNVNEQDPGVWRQQRQSNHTVNVKWTGTLSDSTFAEARVSIANQRRFTDFPNANENTYGYQDTSTGQIFGGWYRELARPGFRNSRQFKTDVTHFTTRGVGTHEIKTGFNYDWLINDEYREWLAGARRHILFNGQPDRIMLSNAPVDQKGRVHQWALYVQDQWAMSNRLTLNLGLRFESAEGWVPEGSVGGTNFPREEFPAVRDIVNFSQWAPRLGAVYDVTGDRRTVVKASFGKYYNQVYTSEFGAAVPFAFGSKVYRWNDLNGDLIWQPGEEGALISDSTVPALGRVDPDIKQSFVYSATVGVDRQLTNTIAVGASFIWKKEYDMAETINAAQPFDEAFNALPLTNPLSGQPITIYPLRREFQGIPTVRYYTNPGASSCSFCPDLERKYRGFELTFRRRLANRWQMFSSYVFSKSYGNKGQGHSESQGNVFASPNNLVFANGRLSLDRPHQFKMQGSYEAPFDIMLSASYSALSGTPWARTVRFLRANSPLIVVESQIVVLGEPVGAQRFDMEHDLSFRAEKRMTLGRTRIGLMVDVFNALNLSTVTSVQQTRIDHPDFGKPGDILLPRTLRIGARIGF